MKPMKPMTFEQWWPKQLGQPSSSGGQNGIRYAFFPEARRLLIERNGTCTTYDSGDHRIGGVSSQQQGGGEASLTFSSQHGPVRLDELRIEGEASVSEPGSGEPATNVASDNRDERGRDRAGSTREVEPHRPSGGAGGPHQSAHEHKPDRPAADERVVFSEEGVSASIVRLVVKGEIDVDMIEAVEDFLRRQKRRLTRPQS